MIVLFLTGGGGGGECYDLPGSVVSPVDVAYVW